MKTIPLSQGQYAIVDDEDFDWLMQWKWHASWNLRTRSFYAVRSIPLPNGKKTTESMHRVILGLGRGDKLQGDHIDHDTLDNRRANVRIVTNQENQHNPRRTKGYTWDKNRRKFEAKIMVNGIKKHLGRFDTPAEARAAYLAAKPIYHPTAPLSVEMP